MAKENLGYRVEDNIAHFTINREEQRNALNLETISLFLKHLDQAECDDTVRAVLITGAGDRAFCSGAWQRRTRQNTGRIPWLCPADEKIGRLSETGCGQNKR